MTQLDILPAPALPLPAQDKWRREQEAFRRLLPELLKSDRNQYVAIHEGQVVERGSDKLEVAGRAYAPRLFADLRQPRHRSATARGPHPFAAPAAPGEGDVK